MIRFQSMTDKRGVGLKHWMVRVTEVMPSTGISVDAVHDLRVALRRCRSIADGFIAFDPDPAWREMKRASRKLFKGLGDLRDTHVMVEWLRRLDLPGESAASRLEGHLNRQEQVLEQEALSALEGFDTSKWLEWCDLLSTRAERIPVDSPVFLHLALERWQRAYELQRVALRNRTDTAFHSLRIALKRFRYTVENFLPSRLELWIKDLREVQDLLGDNHDLFVLWRTAVAIGALKDAALRVRWRETVGQEREQRLSCFRAKMCGPDSVWQTWRAGLPEPTGLTRLAIGRLEVWAEYRDADFAHARHVTKLAQQLLAGLSPESFTGGTGREEARLLLDAAAILHDVGRRPGAGDHHRASARMIRRLEPPLGLTADQLRLIALIARYHRGALPQSTHRRFAEIPGSGAQAGFFSRRNSPSRECLRFRPQWPDSETAMPTNSGSHSGACLRVLAP